VAGKTSGGESVRDERVRFPAADKQCERGMRADESVFFANEKRRRALEWEASSWVGTPFHAHARLKGVGVDCVQLAAALYIATGFLTEFEVGWYPIDGGNHDAVSRVTAWIEQSGRFARARSRGLGI
jgi:hypothetical protein